MPAWQGIAFGVVASGACQLALPGREPVGLSRGDCLLLTRPPE